MSHEKRAQKPASFFVPLFHPGFLHFTHADPLSDLVCVNDRKVRLCEALEAAVVLYLSSSSRQRGGALFLCFSGLYQVKSAPSLRDCSDTVHLKEAAESSMEGLEKNNGLAVTP